MAKNSTKNKERGKKIYASVDKKIENTINKSAIYFNNCTNDNYNQDIIQCLYNMYHYIFENDITSNYLIKGKFFLPTPQRYIKYDYNLQIKLSNQFKEELTLKGVKIKKELLLEIKMHIYLPNYLFVKVLQK